MASNIRRHKILAFALFGIIISVPTAAQNGNAASDHAEPDATSVSPEVTTEIVVQGARLRFSTMKTELSGILEPHEGQLPRFHQPICPSVMGLSQSTATVMEKLIRSLAVKAGLDDAEQNCRPNLTVVIADDGRGFIKELKKERPALFTGMSAQNFDKLLEHNGPSWVWQAIEPKRADGGPVDYVSEIDLGGGPPQRLKKGAYQVKNASLSRLYLPVRHDVNGAFVVIAQEAAVGLTIQQISDFSTVVALAGVQTRGMANLTAPTILNALTCASGQDNCEDGATVFDVALLRIRNQGSANLSSDKELSNITNGVLKILSQK